MNYHSARVANIAVPLYAARVRWSSFNDYEKVY